MVTQSQDDLRKHLQEQLDFLQTSAELFDKGKQAEAKRLAVSIRVLLHDTRHSKSLLGQLNLKDQLFLDTASEKPKTAKTSYAGLVGRTLGAPSPPEYVPHLKDGAHNLIPFDEWWNATIVMDQEQNTISRKELILDIADQDGGAHVDERLEAIYAGVSRDNTMGRMRSAGPGWEPIHGLELASVRQIAHEVITTLEPGYEPASIPKQGNYFVLGEIDVVTEPVPQIPKVGPRQPCPCGSGKRYKHCHGKG